MISSRILLAAVCAVALLASACVAKDPAREVAEAVDGLVVEYGAEPGARYRAAWKRIGEAETAEELRVLVEHLQDLRPTLLVEAVATLDGSPVNYTVGDALFYALCLKFVVNPSGRADIYRQISANPNLASKQSLAAWFHKHGCDLPKLRALHASHIAE